MWNSDFAEYSRGQGIDVGTVVVEAERRGGVCRAHLRWRSQN